MKNGILKALKVLGILLALSGIIFLFIYTQLWNPHVDVFVKNTEDFPLTVEQKLEDFEYLYNNLKESFPYFEVKKRQYGIDWLGRKEEFTERIKAAKTDNEYYAVMSEILMLLQNGHTHIIAPGVEFDEYSELYAGPQPWSQVFENKKVRQCYDYWETVIPESESSMVPIAFRYVEGNYYASKNLIDPEKSTDALGVPMGSKLLKVNGIDVDVYIKDLIKQRLLKYDPVRKKYKLNLFSIRTDAETEITFALPSGEEGKKVLKPYKPDALSEAGRSLPEHLYSTAIIEDGKIAYLRVPSLASSYVKKDRDGIRTFLQQVKDYSSLIIDIRGNGGGSTNYWMDNIVPLLTDKPLVTYNYLLFRDSDYIKPFIKQKTFTGYFGLKPIKDLSFFKEKPGFYYSDDKGIYEELKYEIKPTDPVGFEGKIILLVDESVYSSAEAFAAFAKDTGWAQLVGTRTGGDGIGFDPIPVALPNSGLIVRYPADMGLNPNGSINEEIATDPDIYVEPGYQDFIARIEAGNKITEKLSVKDSLKFDTALRKAAELGQAN